MMNVQGIEVGQRVAVTGALGLVASRTLPSLAGDFELVGLDLREGEVGGVGVRAVDLTDFAAVRSAVAGCAAVVHLAIASERALGHLDRHAYAAAEVSANVLGTRNVFEAAADAGVRRAVYFSSVTVHLGAPERAVFPAAAARQLVNHYAVTKLYGEQLAWLYASLGRLSTVAWRLGQPYPVDFFDVGALADARHRCTAVSRGDMARGIRAGLLADLALETVRATRTPEATGMTAVEGFAVANLVSASDAGPAYGYDLTAGAALGYRPGDCFTAAGPVQVGVTEGASS